MALRAPGFTAEAALGRARGSYCSPLHAQENGASYVIPQSFLPRWPWPTGNDCRFDCVCVTEEGCPCCTTIKPTTVNPVKPIVR
jgi:hypothetical protein